MSSFATIVCIQVVLAECQATSIPVTSLECSYDLVNLLHSPEDADDTATGGFLQYWV